MKKPTKRKSKPKTPKIKKVVPIVTLEVVQKMIEDHLFELTGKSLDQFQSEAEFSAIVDQQLHLLMQVYAQLQTTGSTSIALSAGPNPSETSHANETPAV